MYTLLLPQYISVHHTYVVLRSAPPSCPKCGFEGPQEIFWRIFWIATLISLWMWWCKNDILKHVVAHRLREPINVLKNGWVPRCDWKIVTHHPQEKTFPTMCHHRSKAHRSRSRGTCSTTIAIVTFCYLSQFPTHVHSEGKSTFSIKTPPSWITSSENHPTFLFCSSIFWLFLQGKELFHRK